MSRLNGVRGWGARDLPMHFVYAGHRLPPVRASAFIDFAVDYLTRELAVNEA